MNLLNRVYRWLYLHTTGEPWTHIMRRNPALLAIPALLVLVGAAMLAPRSWVGRAIYSAIVIWLAFLAGHVFWGGS